VNEGRHPRRAVPQTSSLRPLCVPCVSALELFLSWIDSLPSTAKLPWCPASALFASRSPLPGRHAAACGDFSLLYRSRITRRCGRVASLQLTPANLHPCFQQLAGASSRNLFPFMLLHCCPGVYPQRSNISTFQPFLDLSPFFSYSSALFGATAQSQPLCNQTFPHSFSCNGGVGGTLPTLELLSTGTLPIFAPPEDHLGTPHPAKPRAGILSFSPPLQPSTFNLQPLRPLSPFALSAGEVEWKG
jgi:hypothetical protein